MELQEVNDSIISFWGNYFPHILDTGRNILIALLIIFAAKIILSISRHLIDRLITGKLHLDETFGAVMRIGIKYGVIIICLIMILDILGINTTGLIALLGAAGVAVGFALRDTLANIAAGIIILFLRPFRKGDFIEFSSILGTVKEIGLFATELETADGIYISAPNSSIWGVPLKNFSHNDKRRMEVVVSISYTDSIDTAFRALTEIIRTESRFLNDPPPQVMVQSLGESGVEVKIRAWVPSADYWIIYWDHMKIVKEKIQEAGLTISLPKREIHLPKDNHDIPAGLLR